MGSLAGPGRNVRYVTWPLMGALLFLSIPASRTSLRGATPDDAPLVFLLGLAVAVLYGLAGLLAAVIRNATSRSLSKTWLPFTGSMARNITFATLIALLVFFRFVAPTEAGALLPGLAALSLVVGKWKGKPKPA